MIVYRATAACASKAGVGCDRFLPAIQRHHGVGRLEPQFLADQPIRDRVKALLELDMSVAVHLGLRPHGKLRRHVRQADQQASFNFREALERHVASRTVNAVAGFVHHPRVYLAIGVSHATKLA